MKRVAKYELRIGVSNEAHAGTRRALGSRKLGTQKLATDNPNTEGEDPSICLELTSWHQAWDLAYEHLTSEAFPRDTLVIDCEHRDIIASFSYVNLASAEQAAEDESDAEADGASNLLHAQGEKIGENASREFFLTRNTSNYHWRLLNGARHEIPYRLSFLERVLERHPTGPVAYVLELAFELRDRLNPRALQ